MLDKTQELQEKEFVLPYHYLDLMLEDRRLILDLQRLSLNKIVKRLLKESGAKKVLDAGCGDGRLCYDLKKDFKMTGVDYSKKAIGFARAFSPEVRFFVQKLESLKFPGKEKFDTVIMVETLEHIKPKDISKILKNISKVLEREGKLIITVPSVNVPVSEKHYQHFSTESLKETLSEYFEIEKIICHFKKSRLFDIKRKTYQISYPLSSRIRFLKKMYIKFSKNFSDNLEIASQENCQRIIAVCKKK